MVLRRSEDFETARSRRLDWEDKQVGGNDGLNWSPPLSESRQLPTALGNRASAFAPPPRAAVLVPLQTAILSSDQKLTGAPDRAGQIEAIPRCPWLSVRRRA